MKNLKLIHVLTIFTFFYSCKTNNEVDFNSVGFSYNKVIQNPTSGIREVGAPPISCEINRTYIISKDTIYFYSYNESTEEKSYRYSINENLKSFLKNGLLHSIDTLKELKDSTYELSPITVFEQKKDSLKIKNFQMFRLDNKAQNFINSLDRILTLTETKDLKDFSKIYYLNKKIEIYNIADRQPDIIRTIH